MNHHQNVLLSGLYALVHMLFYIPLIQSRGYILGFLLAILILYLIYVLATLIHVATMKCVGKISLQYLVLYPFTYDGSWHFQPIQLLYFPEMVRDVMPINLVQDYCKGQSYGLLKKALKRIRLSREIALLIAMVIVYFLTHTLFPFSVFPFMFSYILIIVQSFLGSGTFWIGNRRIIIDNEFEKILLSKHYLTDIPALRYSEYLACHDKQLTPIELLTIFENLIDSYLRQDKSKIDFDICYDVLFLLYREKYTMGLHYFIRLNYLIYKVGFLGIMYDHEALRNVSKQYLNRNISEIVDLAYGGHLLSKQVEVINECIACLNTKRLPLNDKRFFNNQPYIFSRKKPK